MSCEGKFGSSCAVMAPPGSPIHTALGDAPAEVLEETYRIARNRAPAMPEGADAGSRLARLKAQAADRAAADATYPDLYAAVGVHSGLAYAAAHDLDTAYAAMQHGGLAPARPQSRASQATGLPARVVPTIVFHGDRDTTVNVVNADHVLTPWVQVPEDQDTTPRPDQHVTVERGQVPGGYTYTSSIYHDPQGRALIEKWIVHQMDHAWSGGSPSGSHTDPQGPNASAEMVRCFSEHPQEWSRPLRPRPDASAPGPSRRAG